MMKPVGAVIALLAAAGCMSFSRIPPATQTHVKKIALDYLARHHIEIPKDADIKVEEGTIHPPSAHPTMFYGLSISVLRRGERNVLYYIWLDPGSSRVQEFSDFRHLAPIER
jgi:hypothetical protein